jgi:hypothetical protein
LILGAGFFHKSVEGKRGKRVGGAIPMSALLAQN